MLKPLTFISIILYGIQTVAQVLTPEPTITDNLSSFTLRYTDSVYVSKPIVPSLYTVNRDGSIGEKFTDLYATSGSTVPSDSIYFLPEITPDRPGLYALRIPSYDILRYNTQSETPLPETPMGENNDSTIVNGLSNSIDYLTPQLRVLDIGNSYTQNATCYLGDIAKNLGVDTSNICLYRTLFNGGSFKDWYDIYNDINLNNYYIQHVFGNLKCSNFEQLSQYNGSEGLKSLLIDNKWDLIIIHQASRFAPFYDAWISNEEAGYLPELLEIIRENQPDALIGTLLVHSYGANSFHNTRHLSTIAQWAQIASSAKSMKEDLGIDLIIPYGTAIENLRSTPYNNTDDLLMDGSHLSAGLACYTASCCYYETVFAPWFNKSMAENTFYPSGNPSVTDENAAIAQEAALLACQRPFMTGDVASLESCDEQTVYYALQPTPIQVTLRRKDDSTILLQAQPGKDMDILYDLDENWDIENIVLSWSLERNQSLNASQSNIRYYNLTYTDGKIHIPGELLSGDIMIDLETTYKNSIDVTLNVESGIESISDITLSLEYNRVFVSGLNIGDEIYIYSPAGHTLKNYIADTESICITLEVGIYLLRINDTTARIVNIPR